tara:strand:- start:333 stop:812 length:480 start_codon:yes stop_codon:yes gene_type:complete
MAITLDILKSGKNNDAYKEYTYADLKLDIELNSQVPDSPTGVEKNKQDFKLNYDESAIHQSIKNIFNTKKGQKILSPEFGLDLEQYLFEGVSKENGDIIGNTIFEELPIHEPRIKVQGVDITALPDDHQYTININIIIPSLDNRKTTVTGSLTEKGFNY